MRYSLSLGNGWRISNCGREEQDHQRRKHYPRYRKEEEGKQLHRELLPRTREEEGNIVSNVTSRCWKVMVFFCNNDVMN